MKLSSHLTLKLGLVLALVGVGVLVLPGLQPSDPLAATRIDGASRLTVHKIAMEDGTICEVPATPQAVAIPMIANNAVPVNPVTAALSLRSGASSTELVEVAAQASPTAAQKAAVAARRPIRTIRDQYPQFSAVAVDTQRNEVVIQDENLFQIMVFDRETNTPPTAAMSEPKRFIRGAATYLELNCAIYIDPETGNIYSLNNDTERHMTVWDREARGNASPAWKLRTPMGSFGLAVDEVRQELLITAQHEQVVAAYSKTARDDDPPNWVLWGDQTLIADPHGIAIDPIEEVFFVANFGATSSPREAAPDENPLFVAVTRGNMIPGSGRFYPPSITVYNKTARGNTAPIRVITGPETRLNWPAGLFIDAEREELYVANDGAGNILVFDTKADGNAAPIRVLEGPQTKLHYPTNVFVDLVNDEMWVANMGNHRATVYPRDANGDVAPIREIRSAPDGVPSPTLANVRITYDNTRDQILAPN